MPSPLSLHLAQADTGETTVVLKRGKGEEGSLILSSLLSQVCKLRGDKLVGHLLEVASKQVNSSSATINRHDWQKAKSSFKLRVYAACCRKPMSL